MKKKSEYTTPLLITFETTYNDIIVMSGAVEENTFDSDKTYSEWW